MEKLKCIFCGNELVTAFNGGVFCDTDGCEMQEDIIGKEAARHFMEMKNKLDIAIQFIQELQETRSGVKETLRAYNGKKLNAGNGFCWASPDEIYNVLQQIKYTTIKGQ